MADYALTTYEDGPWYTQPRGKGKRKASDTRLDGDESVKRPKNMWKTAYALENRLGAYEIAQPNVTYLTELAAEVNSFQNELKRLSGSVPSLRMTGSKRRPSDTTAPEGSKARKQRRNSIRLGAAPRKMSAGSHHSSPAHHRPQRLLVSREPRDVVHQVFQPVQQRRMTRSFQARRSSQSGLQARHGMRRRTGSVDPQWDRTRYAFPSAILGGGEGTYSAEPEEYTLYEELVSPTQNLFTGLENHPVPRRDNSGDTELSGYSNGGYYDDIEAQHELDASTVSKVSQVQESFTFDSHKPMRLNEVYELGPFSSTWSFFTPSYIPTSRTPVRKALLIAIQYPGQKWNDSKSTSMNLYGAYEDARDIRRLLLDEGYLWEDIRMMTDELKTPDCDQPTHANLKLAFEELVRGAQPGDRFFLYFAGHGKQVTDLDFDEADGKDEGIVPSDWESTYAYSDLGIIIDDYLRDTCVEPLPKGAQLVAVFDSCHAGTILDLPFRYLRNGDVVVENPIKRPTGESFPDYYEGYGAREPSAEHIPGGFGVDEIWPRGVPRRIYGSVDARVICFSACEDSQNAYTNKTKTQGRVTEAFTTGFRALKSGGQAPTIKELFEYVVNKASLKHERHVQDPQLCSSFRMVPEEVNRTIVL